jgi:hypothetical protein
MKWDTLGLLFPYNNWISLIVLGNIEDLTVVSQKNIEITPKQQNINFTMQFHAYVG